MLMAAIEKDSQPGVALAAGESLRSVAYYENETVPAYYENDTVSAALVGLLQRERWETRRNAALALAVMAAPGDRTVIRALLRRVQEDADNLVVLAAGHALGEVAHICNNCWPANPSGDPVLIAAMIGMLNNESVSRRHVAATALGRVAPPGNQIVIHSLLARVRDESRLDLSHALGQALGKLAPGDPTTVAALLSLLELEGSDASDNAIFALGEVAPKGHQEVINAMLAHIERGKFLDFNTGQALGHVAHESNATVMRLIPFLQSTLWRTRGTAAVALGMATPVGDQATVNALLATLDDSHYLVRSCVAEALGEAAVVGDQVVLAALRRRREKELWTLGPVSMSLHGEVVLCCEKSIAKLTP
jgi:HEAT repeat protein